MEQKRSRYSLWERALKVGFFFPDPRPKPKRGESPRVGWKKETKPEQETKGDAEESTETRRVPQRRLLRRRERVKPPRRK